MCLHWPSIKAFPPKPWVRHQGFGLRSEWLQQYFSNGFDVNKCEMLGPNQKESLAYWLKTSGLNDSNGNQTCLCSLREESGIMTDKVWEILWFNIVSSFATAWWFVSFLGKGMWTSHDLRIALSHHTPRLSKRTASNAVMELLGLFERSPVGGQLRQGIIRGHSRRSVERVGLAAPVISSIQYTILQIFRLAQGPALSLDEELPWPWTVYGCEREYAISQLIMNASDWLEINSERIICRDINKGASNVMGLLGLH